MARRNTLCFPGTDSCHAPVKLTRLIMTLSQVHDGDELNQESMYW